MFFISLFRFLFGYVELIVSGDFTERLLNLCAKQGINVWDIKRKKDKLTLKMSVSDFKNIRKIRGKSGVKIKILHKSGFPFWLRRYGKRAGIPVGFILFFVALRFFSSFIWQIEIVGNKSVLDEEILNVCNSLGVREGVLIKDIDTAMLKNEFLLSDENLAWAAFNIEGSKITVNVTETAKKEDNQPCNIVADFDGVIHSINVISGTAAVATGQAVTKGDLLIGGTVEHPGQLSFIKAKGKITAIVEEDISVRQNFMQQAKEYTGNSASKTVVSVFGVKIPLYLGAFKGQHDAEFGSFQCTFLNEKIPLSFYYKKAEFYKMIDITYTREQLLMRLEESLKAEIENTVSGEYTVVDKEIRENEECVEIICRIRHEKNIGIEEKLLFDTLN